MRKLKHIHKNRKLIIIVIMIGIVFELAVLAFGGSGVSQTQGRVNAQLNSYAKEVLKLCKDAKHRPSCYDREIPKLMDSPVRLSMEDAFQVTAQVQEKDGEYAYCHILGHELSAQEVRRDPTNWKDVITRCPSGICSNGCLHGGLQERFRSETLTDEQLTNLKPEFESLCRKKDNWNPTLLEQASCYHALGHLLMYATAADVQKSLLLCNELTDNPEGSRNTQLCYDGAFMQIFQPLEPEDKALIKGKEVGKDKVDAFCNTFKGAPKASCHTESWPLFLQEILEPQGLIDFCGKAEPYMEERCYNVMFYIVTAQFKLHVPTIKDYCSRITEGRMAHCFAGAASRLIETDYRNIDKAIDMCKHADSLGVGERCFDELILYSSYNFHPGSPKFYELCESLPGEYSQLCLEKAEN